MSGVCDACEFVDARDGTETSASGTAEAGREPDTRTAMPLRIFDRGPVREVRAKLGFLGVGGGDNGLSALNESGAPGNGVLSAHQEVLDSTQ